jgi:hypothetical protein
MSATDLQKKKKKKSKERRYSTRIAGQGSLWFLGMPSQDNQVGCPDPAPAPTPAPSESRAEKFLARLDDETEGEDEEKPEETDEA